MTSLPPVLNLQSLRYRDLKFYNKSSKCPSVTGLCCKEGKWSFQTYSENSSSTSCRHFQNDDLQFSGVATIPHTQTLMAYPHLWGHPEFVCIKITTKDELTIT